MLTGRWELRGLYNGLCCSVPNATQAAEQLRLECGQISVVWYPKIPRLQYESHHIAQKSLETRDQSLLHGSRRVGNWLLREGVVGSNSHLSFSTLTTSPVLCMGAFHAC